MRQGLPVLAFALGLTLSGSALAGVVVTSTETQLGSQRSTPMMVYADGDKLKVVTADTTVIYRGDQQKVWIVNPGQKNYVEMTADTIQSLGGRLAGVQSQLGAAQAQLQQQLANMPPAQRAQIEAMMAGRGGLGGPPGRAGGPPQPPQTSYAKAGAGKTIANIRCDMYRKTVDGQQDADLCVANIASARLTADDFRGLENFSAFIAPIASAPQVPRNEYMHWGEMNRAIGFAGMPLDTVSYVNGMPARQQTVQKIERVNIPANTFDLPAGFAQQSIGPPGR